MSDRTTLAVPIDVARIFDTQVTQAQLNADTFVNTSDDTDQLAAMIEDAEDEFRQYTDRNMRVSRVGVAGQRETYEEVTYELSGHNVFKANFSGVTTRTLPQEVTTDLSNDRVLPFDSTEGDELYIYRGLSGSTGGNTWEDITDEQGDSWAIIDHAAGRVVLDPQLMFETQFRQSQGIGRARGELREVRIAISYRFGGLGGSRAQTAETALDASLSDTQTGTVSVTDGSGFPVGDGSIIVLIGREYLEVEPDPANDQMNIVSRGLRGTTAASHSSDDRIQYTPPAVRKAVAARAGMQLVQSNRYRSWLPDADDDLDSSDVMDELDAIWSGTVEAMS